MIPLLSLFLAILGSVTLVVGATSGRPALVLLAATLLASHALPLLTIAGDPLASASLLARLETVAAIAVVASLCWVAGYWLCTRPTQAMPVVTLDPTPRAMPIHWLLALLLSILIVTSPGGIIGFAQRGFLRLPVETLHFSLTYALACLFAFTTALAAVAAAQKNSRPPWLSMALILGIFWLLGGRVQLVITALAFALVFLAHGRVDWPKLLLPGLAVLGLSALTLIFRLTLQGDAIDPLSALGLMASQISLLEGYALSVRFVEEHGHHLGHYWETMQQILPRALFPDKPLQLSRALRLMEARDLLGGLTPGLAGEAFVAGGYIAVAAISIAFGAMLAVLDNCYRRLPTLSPLGQAAVVSILPLLVLYVLRGGLDTSIFRVAILALAVLVGLWWRSTRLALPRTAS